MLVILAILSTGAARPILSDGDVDTDIDADTDIDTDTDGDSDADTDPGPPSERCNARDDDGNPSTTDAGLVTVNDSVNHPTLDAALAAAVDGDAVTVCTGTYVGGFTIDAAISLSAPEGLGSVVLQGTGNDPVLRVGRNAVVSEVTVLGAIGDEMFGDAAGVWVEPGAELILVDSEIIENEGYGLWVDVQASATVSGSGVSHNHGGGVRIETGGFLDLGDSFVTDNDATQGAGVSVGPFATVVGGWIWSNVATSDGGGLWVEPYGSVFATSVTGNAALTGGGVVASPLATLEALDVGWNYASIAGAGVAIGCGAGTATLRNVDIHENFTEGSGGGVGILACGATTASVDLTGSTIRDNVADGFGGGVWFGTSAATGGTITGNTSVDGGGIWMGAGATLADAEITGNTATGAGGGVFAELGATIGASTVASNTAVNGGGIAVASSGGTVTVDGTSIRDNTATGAGGGVHVSCGADPFPPSSISLGGSTAVTANHASSGAGIHSCGSVFGASGEGTVVSGNHGAGVELAASGTVSSLTIAGNEGSGLVIGEDPFFVSVEDCSITGNLGPIGSALEVPEDPNGFGPGAMQLVNSRIASNGGQSAIHVPEGNLELIDTWIEENVTQGPTMDLGDGTFHAFGDSRILSNEAGDGVIAIVAESILRFTQVDFGIDNSPHALVSRETGATRDLVGFVTLNCVGEACL